MLSLQISSDRMEGLSSGPGSGWRARPSCLVPGRPTPKWGGRSTSAATPHTKRRCRRDSVSTFPVGPDGTGEGNAVATPFVTTPCIATMKVWMVKSDIPRAVRPVAGAVCGTRADRACCPSSRCGSQSPGWKPGVRGGGEGRGLGGYGGVGSGDLCLPSPVPGDQNVARGSPLFSEFPIFPGLVAVPRVPTISSLPSPLCLLACVGG